MTTSSKEQASKVAVLQEQMQQVNANIEAIKNDIATIKDKLDDAYVKKSDYNPAYQDHENRLRRLESWGAIAIGLLYALQFYFQFLKK